KRIAYQKMNGSPLRVLAVSSGKGGVGKTNVVANLAFALSQRGKKVLVVDADLGLNNIDILLGLAPKYHIGHVLSGEKQVKDILVRGPADIQILP
ncbi:MAG: P-loop NTPase, partial [Nitrospinaceae bacterium]|nr:MinD/ParA family protein [Nitrospinaceae bacterium]NIR55774.1 MinD/ParA family protein [Nitrospinaceae bacterium]NIS86226.1 MinD/ParA family protein [Nitrospinaceae bacterium]NIT83057.1 MinD/ParA family protein [Nitrospinaceae bacterium]NIU45267.1 MinD/ParA family protein [Nitrospinaceae bacterium]